MIFKKLKINASLYSSRKLHRVIVRAMQSILINFSHSLPGYLVHTASLPYYFRVGKIRQTNTGKKSGTDYEVVLRNQTTLILNDSFRMRYEPAAK